MVSNKHWRTGLCAIMSQRPLCFTRRAPSGWSLGDRKGDSLTPACYKLEALREHWPQPNASIIELWQFFPDPDRDPEGTPGSPKCNQSLSRPHPSSALHKMLSKSVSNFFNNPVNADFGLRTPGSGRWSGSSPKLIPVVLAHALPLQEISSKSVHNFSSYPTDRQTNRLK